MSGLSSYLPTLEVARLAAQQAHAEGWRRAKAGLVTATANITTNFASTTEKAKGLASDGAAWARENPGKATMYGASGAVGLVTVAAPGAIAAPILALGGFGSNGIVGGSLAAGIQSGIGNVIAPSLFATCQSAAMGGYGVAAVNTAVQLGGAALAASAGAGTAVIGEKKKGNDEGLDENGENENDEEDEA